MRRALAIAAAVLATAAAPAGAQAPPPTCPQVTARATIVIEATTGQVACERAADEQRPIASATKLMTALLVLENAELSDVLAAAPYRPLPIESKIDLRTGEQMTIADLLRALLLESANDAAVTLAAGTAGSREAFVERMNARAAELGMTNTSFANPIGLDDPDNHSSARDLATLTLRLQRYDFFRRTVDRPSAELRSGDRERFINNRNDLVQRVGWIDGVKTGHTSRAGYVLVGSGRRRGIRLISVVLGSRTEETRSTDTLKILERGFRHFRVVPAVRAGETFGAVPIRYRRGAALPLVARRTVRLTLPRAQAADVEVRTVGRPTEIEGRIEAGRRLGTVEVLAGGEVVARTALIASSFVPEAGLGQRVKHYVTRPLTIALVLAVAACSLILVRLARRRDSGEGRGRSREQPEAA